MKGGKILTSVQLKRNASENNVIFVKNSSRLSTLLPIKGSLPMDVGQIKKSDDIRKAPSFHFAKVFS